MMEVVITQNEQELERLEGIIQKNIGSFYEVGHALAEIRDQGYYRDVLGYETFEAYCKAKWDFSRSYAYRLIESANVIDVVSPIGDIKPTTESQARPLALLPADQQLIAWQKAVETAPDGKVTGAHVYKIVKRMTNPPSPKQLPKTNNKIIIGEELVSAEFQNAFDQMDIELKNARAMKWKTTSHKAAIGMMQILLTIAEQ